MLILLLEICRSMIEMDWRNTYCIRGAHLLLTFDVGFVVSKQHVSDHIHSASTQLSHNE